MRIFSSSGSIKRFLKNPDPDIAVETFEVQWFQETAEITLHSRMHLFQACCTSTISDLSFVVTMSLLPDLFLRHLFGSQVNGYVPQWGRFQTAVFLLRRLFLPWNVRSVPQTRSLCLQECTDCASSCSKRSPSRDKVLLFCLRDLFRLQTMFDVFWNSIAVPLQFTRAAGTASHVCLTPNQAQ